VGANLVDHLGIAVVFKSRNRCDNGQPHLIFGKSILSFIKYKARGTGAISSQIGEAANFVRLEEIAPDFVAREKANGTYQERASGPNSPHIELIFTPIFNRQHGTIMPSDTKNYYSIVALLLNPCSSGKLTIAPKFNPSGDTQTKTKGNGSPDFETVIDPNYFSDPFDLRVMAEAVKFIRRLARRMNEDPEIGGRECYPGEQDVPDHDDAGLQAYVRTAVETYYHPTSTCRMGPTSDTLAVVDNRLNVYGIDRLRVIDAS
ncbi:hypothetical protein BGZ65_000035, partial [Modicella reniformis]